MRHDQFIITIINKVAQSLGHHFAVSDSELERIFSIADLLAADSGLEWGGDPDHSRLAAYEHLISAKAELMPTGICAGIMLDDYKGALKNDELYTWETATGRYQMHLTSMDLELEVWREGGRACSARMSLLNDGKLNAPYMEIDEEICEPRHVHYLDGWMREMNLRFGVPQDEVYSQIWHMAAKKIGMDAVIEFLNEIKELAPEHCAFRLVDQTQRILDSFETVSRA